MGTKRKHLSNTFFMKLLDLYMYILCLAYEIRVSHTLEVLEAHGPNYNSVAHDCLKCHFKPKFK